MRFEVYPSRQLLRRCWRWRLVAANGEIIASGEAYTRRAGALHAIELIRLGAADAPVKILDA
jgi:uncharacterized protein YegP (UPF0339 family)